MATSAVLDLYRRQETEQRGYPFTLYKPELAAETESPKLLDILDEVLQCNDLSTLPKALRQKITGLGLGGGSDAGSDLFGEESNWTLVDLPRQHHTFSSVLQTEEEKDFSNGRLCSTDGWMASEEEYDDEHDSQAWYQLDAGCVRTIGGVEIKPHSDDYIVSFICKVSEDETTWEHVDELATFDGPTDFDERASVYFQKPVIGRYLRIYITEVYDMYPAGHFGLYIEVSDAAVMDGLKLWCQSGGIYAAERLTAFLDKTCEKTAAQTAQVLGAHHRQFKRNVEATLEEVADAQGVPWTRVLQLIINDQKHDKSLPECDLWPLLAAVRDVQVFEHLLVAQREKLRAFRLNAMNTAGKTLPRTPGLPDMADMHAVSDVPTTPYDRQRQRQQEQGTAAFDSKIASLNASLENGTLKKAEHSFLVGRAEKLEMALGWMMQDDTVPIWAHSVYTAEFLSSNFDQDVRSDEGMQAFTRLLRDVILEQQVWLGSTKEEFVAFQYLLKTCANAVPLFQRFSKYCRWSFSTHLELLVSDIGDQLSKLMPGQTAMFPVTLQPFILIVECTEAGTCRVTVVNTNPECGYHPQMADRPARIRQHTCVTFDNVSLELIQDKTWWLFAVPVNLDDADHGDATKLFYTHILNYLTPGRTYESMIVETFEEQEIRTPCQGGGMLWKALHHAAGYILRRQSVRKPVRKLLKFNMRLQMLQWVIQDMNVISSLPSGHSRLIRLGCEQVAAAATKAPGVRLSKGYLKCVLDCMDQIQEEIKRKSPDEHGDAPPLLELDAGHDKNVQSDLLPGMEYLRRDDDVEHLTGERVPEANFLPPNFLSVPDAVRDLDTALAAIRNADTLCTRVMVQRDMIRSGSNLLIVALLQHLFVWVLPFPRFAHKDCLWQRPLRYAQQLELLVVLGRVMEHWAAACLSLLATAEFDGVRITIAGCIAAIADCAIRQKAIDEPSKLCQHIAGYRSHAAFGFTTGEYAKQSETIKVTSPELLIARTAVLDYFECLHETVPQENKIFLWEAGLDRQAGAANLFFKLAIHEAFPLRSSYQYLYNTEADPMYLMLKNFPELGPYRDIAFYFKYLMNTIPGGFPTGQFTQFQAQLKWEFDDQTDKYVVKAFGLHLLPMAKKDRHRWPSYATASRFTHPIPALTEDDVLHIKSLPSFGDVVGQRDSELLLSYLTTPYIRIPLVLQFFATEDRVSLLRAPSMQQVLDSVLFEPGRYQKIMHSDIAPKMVPSEDEGLLATPYGLLINELQHSPSAVVTPLLRLLTLATELDSGTVFNDSAVKVMLYLVRMTSRVYNYLWFLVAFSARNGTFHAGWDDQELRGVTPLAKPCLSELKGFQREFLKAINERLCPMLETWTEEAMCRALGKTPSGLTAVCGSNIDEMTRLVSTLQAHIVLLRRNAPMNVNVSSSLLSSIVFLTLRHTWNSTALVVPETEIYEVMQLQRRRMANLLCGGGPIVLSEVLDGVVRVATSTGSRKARPEDPTYNWAFVAGYASAGRFTYESLTPRKLALAPGPKAEVVAEALGEWISNKAKESVEVASLKNRHFGLYFSAEWCPPCKAFTPILQRFYDNYRKTHPEFEIVFCSNDRTEDDYNYYYEHEHGDWLTIPFADSDRRRRLGNVFDVNSLPAFVIVGPDGKVCNMHGRDRVSRGLQKVLDVGWEPDPLPDLISEVKAEAARSGIKSLHPSVSFCQEFDRTVEVSVMTFDFTFKSGHLRALPTNARSIDIVAVFDAGTSLQCATVENSQHRDWYRLVGRDHDIQVWTTLDERVVLPQCDREYPEELEEGERWIQPLLDPIKRRYVSWADHLYYLPTRPMGDDEVATFIEVVDFFTGVKQFEIYAFKHLNCLQIYSIYSYGRRHYRSLVYCTDARYSLRFLQPDAPETRKTAKPENFRFEAGNLDTKLGGRAAVILRHVACKQNRAGCVEQFIPARLLWGLIPDCLLEEHLFWQDSQDCLRGYPKDAMPKDGAPKTAASKDSSRHLLFVQLRDVNFQSLRESFTTARIIRYAAASSCPKTRERKKLKPEKEHEDLPEVEEIEMIRTSTFASDGMARGASDDFARQSSSLSNDDGKPALPKPAMQAEDQDLLLLNLLHAREGSPLRSLAKLLTRMDDLSHVLVWTNNLNLKDGEPIDLTWVHLPRLKLSFKGRATAEGTQLVSLDHAHLYVSNLRGELTVHLIQGAPHSLFLQDKNGEMSVLIPAFRLARPDICDNPFTTELVIDRCDEDWLKLSDTRYFLYPIHVSLSFLQTPTLASSLYLLLIRLLARLYDDSFRLAGTVGTDTALTDQESLIFDSIGEISDLHPAAHACRCRLTLQTVDSPLDVSWYAPDEAFQYLVKRSKIAATCRLSQKEEALLMWIVDITDKKMAIVREYAKRDKKPWEVLAREDYPENIDANERRLVKGFVQSLQKAFRDELNLRLPFKDVVRECEMCQQNDTELTPFTRCLLQNHIRYVTAETAGEKQAVVEVPDLGGDDYVDFDAHYDHLKEAKPVRLTNHVFQRQIRVHEILSRVVTLTREKHKSDIAGSTRPATTFLFFIELLTGETVIKLRKHVLDGKCAVYMMLPWCYYSTDLKDRKWDTQRYMIAMLQALKHDPMLIERVPLWAPDRKDREIRGCRNWNDSVVAFASFMRDLQAKLNELHGQGALVTPTDPKSQKKVPRPPPSIDIVVRLRERSSRAQPLLDTLCLPALADSACSSRRLLPASLDELLAVREDPAWKASVARVIAGPHLKSFSDMPLSVLPGLLNSVEHHTRRQRDLPEVSADMPFDVESHPASRSQVAQLMLARLHDDVKSYAEKANSEQTCILKGLSGAGDLVHVVNTPQLVPDIIERLTALSVEIKGLQKADNEFLQLAIPALIEMGNKVPDAADDGAALAFRLRRYSRLEVAMWLEYILGSLISSDMKGDLLKLNPFLADVEVERMSQLITVMLLATSRVGLANKACDELHGILELLHSIQSNKPDSHSSVHLQEEKFLARLAALSQKNGAVARMLTVQRSYLQPENSPGSVPSYLFDPRFMLFEFTWNIVLRQSQVTMVNNFVASLREGRSHVKQMIMGAGKTTVVGPLVVLMSADGSTLLMQVVPPSLLDFSRGVLRSTFASLIPKAIYTFVCDRTSEIDVLVVNKFQRAVSSRGVVVTTPSSLKSIFLKFVEGIERMADESRLPPPPELEAETRDLKKLLILWKDKAVVVMDEVDLLLHPLKSELNFPIGEKHDLPLLSLRWRLPIHLFDAIYFHNLGRMSVSFKDSSKAKVILSELQQVLKGGFESRALQDTPHVILLNLGYFSTKVKPIMAKWLQLWLESLHVTSLSEEHTVAYLSSPEKRAAMKEHVEATVPKYDIMLLNLGHDWLHAFLPHCLQKIDRVSFGIMTPFDIDRALQENPQMPRSRIKLAIPFIGKDLPSQSSEFAHPDVVIGLTILAYRYEGLRESDFTEVLKLVLTSVEKEVGKFSQRKTNKMYDRWIEAANGRVTQVYNYDRGTGKGLSEELAEAGRQRTVEFVDLATKEVLSLSAYAAVLAIVADALFVEVAPLRKLKQSNREEFEKLYKLLRLTPEVIHWFLEEIVFPEYMRHQTLKLSASGQELGSDVIFKSRIGFSGTPSDLLPEELGRCDYEKCTDGQLIHTLTSAHTVSYHLLEKGWTVQSVLEAIASQQPPFHALIDTGALITGLSNLEVAQYLMSKDRMPQMEGCIFLDELDRKMILVRATNRVIKLEECGIPKLKRFTFYDQVHTTGLDVSHAPNAQAALTLGKDMTFRDFAQGAYRMRGIGTGQTVDLIIIPEVYDLMSRELVLAGMHSMPKNPPADSGMCADEAVTRNVLVSTVAWLMVNSMRTEKLQYNQLCVQKISAVYRKEAFQDLLNRDGEFTLRPGVRPTKRARDALNIYRQPVEFSIPDFVPQDRLFADVLRGLVESEDPPNKSFVPKEGWAVVDRILNEVHKEKQRHQENHDVQMVQEQEEEKEDEEEKEEEKEIEVEKYIDLVYSRDSEEPVAWEVGALASLGAAKQFYAMEDFRMYRKRNIAFPESLMASRNFFDLRWGGERRIKNVVCLLEWVPAAAALAIKDKPSRDFGAVCAPPLSGILKFFGDEKSCDLSTTVDILKIALGTAPKRAEIKKTLFADKSALTPSDLQSVLESNILRNEEDGRRYVAVSLREAETLRRILHVKTRLNEPFLQSNPDTHVAIRCVPAGGVVLDRTQGFPAEPHSVTYHADKALASFRYFDGEVSYTDADLNLLLRSLHCSPPAQRLVFFQQVVGCRRRGTVARSENTPLAKVCRLIDAYALLYQRSLGSCMHREIEARDLSLGEAFTAMNSSGSGVILPAELWGGLRWLGIECSSQQVLDFIATADSVNEGNLAYPDFLAITTGKQDEEDVPDDNEGKHLPVVEKYGEELLRAEAIAMRNKALQEHQAAMAFEEEADRAAEKRVFEEEDAAFKAAGLTSNPHLNQACDTICFGFDKEALPRHVLAYGQAFPVKEKYFNAELKEEIEAVGWDLGSESYLKIPLRLVSKYAETIEEVDYGSDSDDDGDIPDALLLHVPRAPAYGGVYKLQRTEGIEPDASSAVWQSTDKTLFLGSGGAWLVGTGSDAKERNVGRIQSVHKSFGLLPHRINEWKRAEGSGADSAWTQDPQLFFCPVYNAAGDAAPALDVILEIVVTNVSDAIEPNVNGIYAKASCTPDELRRGIESKFSRSSGGAVIYNFENRWRLSDTGTSAHLFSNAELFGDWLPDAEHDTDFRAKNRAYPAVYITKLQKDEEAIATMRQQLVPEVKNGFRDWSFTCSIRFPTRRALSEVCLARISPGLVILLSHEGVVRCVADEKVKLSARKAEEGQDDTNKVVGFQGFTADAIAGYSGYGNEDDEVHGPHHPMGNDGWWDVFRDLWDPNAKAKDVELDPEEMKELLDLLAEMDPDAYRTSMMAEYAKKTKDDKKKGKSSAAAGAGVQAADDDDEEKDDAQEQANSEQSEETDSDMGLQDLAGHRVALDDGDWHVVTVAVSEKEALGMTEDPKVFEGKFRECVAVWRQAADALLKAPKESEATPTRCEAKQQATEEQAAVERLLNERVKLVTVDQRHDTLAVAYCLLKKKQELSYVTPTNLAWDRVEQDLLLENKDRTVTVTAHRQNRVHTALANCGIDKGRLVWEITPSKFISGAKFGVCTEDIELYEGIWDKATSPSSAKCIVWYSEGRLLPNLLEETRVQQCSRFSISSGDVIRFKLDMTRGILELWKGNWKVSTIKDLPKDKKLYPFCSFDEVRDGCTIRAVKQTEMDSTESRRTILKTIIDGKKVDVEKQPRIQPTRLTLEHGFQLFGGEKVSALHMNGAVLKDLAIKIGYTQEADIQTHHEQVVTARTKLAEEREKNAETSRRKESRKLQGMTQGGENDPDAEDDAEARQRRLKMKVVNKRDDEARKARLNAIQRWRRLIVGEDTVKGKEREDEMIKEKLHKVLDVKLQGIEDEFDSRKKPIDRQFEVLSLERDHADNQGLSTQALDDKLATLTHRLGVLDKQRQLNLHPIKEKKDMVNMKYIHVGREHKAEQEFLACKLKIGLVHQKENVISLQNDIKVMNISHQAGMLKVQLENLLHGSPDWERVSHQIRALEAKEKRHNAQAKRDRAKFAKLLQALSKELDRLCVAKEKDEKDRRRQEEEKQKQEQGFSSDEDSDEDMAWGFFRRRTPEEQRKRIKKKEEKREKVRQLYSVLPNPPATSSGMGAPPTN